MWARYCIFWKNAELLKLNYICNKFKCWVQFNLCYLITLIVIVIIYRNCLVSSSLLKEKMQGREAVPLSRLKNHIAAGKASSDWVVAGVIIQKSCMKLSQKV